MVSETEATTAEFPAEAETQEPKVMPNPQLAELGLDAPSSLDNSGSILIPEDGTLLNISIPEYLSGQVLNDIAPNAFAGTNCLRSITLPSSITTIGENAFADCPHLEYIVLQDRFNLEGLTLGENWNGNATVIFGLVQETYSTESTEEDVESSDPKQELSSASASESSDIDTTLSEDTEDLNSEDTVTE